MTAKSNDLRYIIHIPLDEDFGQLDRYRLVADREFAHYSEKR